MKIYFGFTVAGDRSSIDTARKVVHWLEEMGHEVLTRHLVSDNAWEADRSIGAQDVYRRDMAWLSNATFSLQRFRAPLVWGSRQVICWAPPARKSSFSIDGRCNGTYLF
jgi:hypothetical protein